MLYRFLLVTAIVFLSVSVHAVSLSSNGEVHTVTQGNLEFRTDGSGLVKLFKNGEYLSSFGFTLKGTVNAQQKFLNSWSTAWTWQVLSNTDSNITVLGSTNWQGLEWKQRWEWGEDEFGEPTQKFTNYLTNNTGFDVTNTSFYYVVRFDETNRSCLSYVDNDGKGNKYCFEQDITKTQNLEQYLNRINFSETMFNFQDLIDDGFQFNYLYAGNLNNAHNLLAGDGFIIGVTKNGGLFPNGASIELDPSVIDTSRVIITNYGNTIVRDSSGNIFEVFEQVVGSTNTDIFISKSTDDGTIFSSINITNTTDKNESFPHMDINSTDGLIIQYDVKISTDATKEIFVTTCSTGGCDDLGEFLDDLNVSECGIAQECSHGSLEVDVNNISHLLYAKGGVGNYRQNTGFVGSSWGAEVATNLDTTAPLSGTGIIVAKNGSDRRLVFANPNGAQLTVAHFNGSVWGASLLLGNPRIAFPPSGFAGYDGNFYLSFTQEISVASTSRRIHFRQCIVTDDCSSGGNWSADLNISTNAQTYTSIFQSVDLNVNLFATNLVSTAGSGLFHYPRLPNGTWATSNLADTNRLVDDANRQFDPLVRNRGQDGSAIGGQLLPSTGTIELDFTYRTSNNSTGNPNTLIFDSRSYLIATGIIAAFTTNPVSPISLDPEEGITNIPVDFNSTTEFLPPGGIVDINYLWQVDGEEISTDQNTVRDFNGPDADFNVSLIVQGNDGGSTFTSQSDQNILLREGAQDVDINFVFNAEATLVDVNYGVTVGGGTSTINFAVWGFPNDNNLSGLVVNQQYRVGDTRDVCVVVNTTGDVNKLHCEGFFNTHITVKIPKDITNLSLITPYDASIDSTPPQAFTGLSVDGNFWFFYQTNPDSNSHNVIVDANISFFLSTYFVGLNAFDLNQTIQPYMVPATDGINVIITSRDSLTNNSVKGVVVAFSRVVSTDGDVEVVSGVTDDLGRISLPFIAGIDTNFTLQFPFGTIIRTGTYIPQTIDASNGVGISVASSSLFDVNAIGVTDINYLQSQATPNSPIDINVIIEKSSRAIAAMTVTIDHNGVFLDSNSVGIVTLPHQFNFSIEVGGFDTTIPVVVTTDINYVDGGSFRSTKAVTINVSTFNLFQSFTTAKSEDLGDLGGTMFLSAVIIAIVLGILHTFFPMPDNSPTFVIAALILLFLSFVGWVDGVTWVIATIGAGAVYFLRRVDK